MLEACDNVMCDVEEYGAAISLNSNNTCLYGVYCPDRTVEENVMFFVSRNASRYSQNS